MAAKEFLPVPPISGPNVCAGRLGVYQDQLVTVNAKHYAVLVTDVKQVGICLVIVVDRENKAKYASIYFCPGSCR